MALDQSKTPWCDWKIHWRENLEIATAAACLEAGAFLLFLFLMVQESHFLSMAGLGALLVFWVFNVGISALNAYLSSHRKFAPVKCARDTER